MSRSQGGRWMDVEEASAYMGVAIPTLYRMIDRGDVPAYRIGESIRLRHHEVEAYMERTHLGSRRSYRRTRRDDQPKSEAGHRSHSSRRAPRTAKRPRSHPPA